jgi:hypothetical protein
MTTTYTATAMSAVSRNMPSGTVARSAYFNNTNTTDITASANALRVQFFRIPNQASIMYLQEWHSCGANTCLADIGIKDQVLTLSAFMTQVTQGQANWAAKLPYIVSITDTQATSYAYIVGGYTPGTATSSFEARMNCIYTMDQF